MYTAVINQNVIHFKIGFFAILRLKEVRTFFNVKECDPHRKGWMDGQAGRHRQTHRQTQPAQQ
jgi:hypothetical protein